MRCLGKDAFCVHCVLLWCRDPSPLSIVDCVPSHVGPLHLLFDSQRTKMRRPLVASPHFHKALPLFMVPLLPTLITLPTPPSIPFCSSLLPPPLSQILYPTPQVKNLPPLTPSRTLRGSTPLIRRRRPWCKQLARRRGNVFPTKTWPRVKALGIVISFQNLVKNSLSPLLYAVKVAAKYRYFLFIRYNRFE